MIEKEIKILLSKEQYEKIEKVFSWEKEIYPNKFLLRRFGKN
mgnify:CR=1 FL=1